MKESNLKVQEDVSSVSRQLTKQDEKLRNRPRQRILNEEIIEQPSSLCS